LSYPNRPKMAMQEGSRRGFAGDIAAIYCSAMFARFDQLKTGQIPEQFQLYRWL
jgi:hypothetical protein